MTAAGARASPRHSRSAALRRRTPTRRAKPLRKSVSVPNLPQIRVTVNYKMSYIWPNPRPLRHFIFRRQAAMAASGERGMITFVAGEREPEEAPGRLLAAAPP